MLREYFIRGQKKTVEEIDDVVAVRVAAAAGGLRAADHTSFGAEARADETGMDSETLSAFADARWLFVQPSAATRSPVRAASSPSDADSVGKLVKRPSGRFGVVTRRLNVQLQESLTADEVDRALSDNGLSVVTRLGFAPNLFEVDATQHADALEASVALNADARFTLAEPSVVEHVPVRLTPTDPRYTEQWQWSNPTGGDVRAEAAWNKTRGADVRVAVIDNGFLTTHEDLSAGVSAASGFFRNIGGGAVGFVPGTTGMPVSDHGTFCAGIVGARQSNGLGVSGAAPECELLLVACLDDQIGTQTTLARAVAYCANPALEVPGASPGSGADILVSSLGPNGADWDLTGQANACMTPW